MGFCKLTVREREQSAFVAVMFLAMWANHAIAIWGGAGAADRTGETCESEAAHEGRTFITASAFGNWLGTGIDTVFSVSRRTRSHLEAGVWNERIVLAVAVC